MRNMLPPLPERSKRPAPVETEIVANRSRRERQLDEIAHRWKPQRKQQKLSDALDKQRLTLRKKAEKKEEVPVKREPEETERNVTQRTPLQALHLLRKNIHNRGKFAKVVETLLQPRPPQSMPGLSINALALHHHHERTRGPRAWAGAEPP
eukprot:GHVU01157768.1.p1 GENE.GHVU01157768.1~~GHVU01157768.1.p1  ORF type:complete len:151 (+),score=19.64 GHVU01157768.1:134-586(+)